MLALGVATQSLSNLDEAKTCYRRVLELRPGDISAQFNLASALYAEANYAESEAMCRAVTKLADDHASAWCLLSKTRLMQGDIAGALEFAEQVLRVRPEEPEGRLMRGTLLLTLGDWLPGWKDLNYCLRQKEYRLRLSDDDHGSSPPPTWDGAQLGGRTILVHGEYGLGDTLHFVRYLPLVRNRVADSRVLVGVHPRLIPLLAQSGIGGLMALNRPLPEFDVRVGMMSLPGIFETTLDTIPGTEPYLVADPRLIEYWHGRLSDIPGFRVGIHWQGDSTFLSDRHRSIPLSSFAPLAQVAGVKLISLQKGREIDQIAAVADEFSVMSLDDQGGAFMDTAAVMKNLDLVITSDTAVAHLAGALGVRVWVALSAAPDWRWMVDRDDSPWYPSMRLFRQTKLDDWSGVFRDMAAELSRMIGEGRRKS
jgi:hypothetical protein